MSSSTLTLANGQVIAYHLDSVTPHAPTIILANPLCAAFTVWDHVIPPLTAAGFSVLRYNQPGHGDSTAPKPSACTFASIAAGVHELLDLLKIKSLHAWVGVSMGAATGVVFATAYPGLVNKLVICDTISTAPVHAGQPNLFADRVAAAEKAGTLEPTVTGTMDRWFGQAWLQTHAAEAERIKALMLTTKIEGFAACCGALASETFDLRPLFGKVGASVQEALLVVGEKDADLPVQMKEMRDKVQEGFEKQVELKVIKGAGHVCFVDGLEEYLSVVVPFLQA
ncbi:hypothetical protein TD95_004511 [Thielaviopsis punctulata]|uniref:AB hydrolase-1 domain-containing protein n=1 Tax=Thielaviopsis punctulata TaxID=72032 RepID=A0A0F4ZHS9_9PEZI|nr:hypothetical protein TD95_004511 [Thielaviopsis punctulata]